MTRAGCECVGHILQSETDASPDRTVLSIDGIGAFDLVSRESMLRGLLSVEGGHAALPFVRQFYGAPSTYLWQDDMDVVHEVHQGEGGEQGDALMPALFSLGQHNALVAVQQQLGHDERMFAFLDDIYVTSRPDRVVPIFNILRRELWTHARIQIHLGKTQIWNQAGVKPVGCDVLTMDARRNDPDVFQRSTSLSWTAFPRCKTFRALGCCSCFALLPGRITSSACFTQTSRACSLHNTTVPSGDVWNNCCTQPCQTGRGLWPPYHWQWVGWV